MSRKITKLDMATTLIVGVFTILAATIPLVADGRGFSGGGGGGGRGGFGGGGFAGGGRSAPTSINRGGGDFGQGGGGDFGRGGGGDFDRGNTNFDTNRNVNGNDDMNRNVNVNGNDDMNRNVYVNDDNRYDDYHGGGYYGGDYYPAAAGLAVGVAVGVAAAAIGSQAYSLPEGCSTYNYDGPYYQCGNVWYQPQYQGSDVTYVVVNQPQ